MSVMASAQAAISAGVRGLSEKCLPTRLSYFFSGTQVVLALSYVKP